MKLRILTSWVLSGAGFLVSACQWGGTPTAGLEAPSTRVQLSSPVITTPTESTHYSRGDSLLISGLCNTGATVSLAGADIRQTTCENSVFSFTVTTVFDGVYPYFITQSASDGTSSLPTTLFWIRKKSIAPPTITSPSANPYMSGVSQLTLTGNCESGSEVTLSGSGTDSTICDNSSYSLSTIQFVDGTYNFVVRQTDRAGNSASANFQWIKEALKITPSAPQLIAAQSQIFTVSGGSGTYTGALLTNNSGATYDTATRTYTAGQLAGVRDTLRFEDTQGNRVDVPIQVVADVPDHLEIPADGENMDPTLVDTQLSTPLKVRVVDRFGNPVSPVYLDFMVTNGDARTIGSHRKVTDSNGLIKAQFLLKGGHSKNKILVKPSFTTLPDTANSGNSSLKFQIFSKTNNTGSLGSSFPTTSNPDTIRIGDFNKDGIPDAAILNRGEPSLGLFYGLGNGLFQSMVKIRPICVGPSDFVTRDFNNDTHLDFALACAGSDRISIVLADGAESYLPVAHTNVQPDETLPVAIESADFNGDSKLDLVTAASGGSVIAVRFGVGDGSFSAPVFYTVGLGPSALGIGDFNKDGFKDIAVLNSAQDNVGLLLNQGVGTFATMEVYPTGAAPSDLAVGDLNGDQFSDVAVVNYTDNTMMVLLNDQFGALNSGVNYSVGLSPTSVVFTDLNGDSIKDAVVANSDDATVSVLEGKADGSFEVKTTSQTFTNPVFVQSADMNGDNKADVLVASNGDQKMQFLAGQGNFSLGMIQPIANAPSSMTSEDFNGDGHRDIAVTQKGINALKIYMGNSLGLWTEASTLSTLNTPVKVISDDFNMDGFVDLAVIHQNTPAVRIFRGDGIGGFADFADYTTGLQPLSLISKDLNHDGFPDLAIANSGSASISVLANDGTGNFLPKSDFATGANKPSDILAADLNSDGEMDLVTANFESQNLSVFLSNGSIAYQTAVLFEAGAGPNSLVSGYFNNDEFVDIAVANEQAGNVAVLLGQGDGSLGGPNTYWANTEPRSLKSGDLNGDGKIDLIVSNPSISSMMVLYGAGNGQFNLTDQFSTSSQSISELLVQDINQDHSLDVLTVDSTNGLVQTWMGH